MYRVARMTAGLGRKAFRPGPNVALTRLYSVSLYPLMRSMSTRKTFHFFMLRRKYLCGFYRGKYFELCFNMDFNNFAAGLGTAGNPRRAADPGRRAGPAPARMWEAHFFPVADRFRILVKKTKINPQKNVANSFSPCYNKLNFSVEPLYVNQSAAIIPPCLRAGGRKGTMFIC